MNERLPDQAWLGYDPERGDIHGYTPEQMREFTELILADVMSICEDLGDKGMDGHYCVDAIRNKFGLWPVVLDSEENT